MIDIAKLRKDKRPQSSIVVHALLDRLEAAESECLEQARLNGMGAEREAALLAKLEAAEKDIAIKEEVIDSLAAVIKRLDAQCDAAEKSDAESIAMYRKARDERDALRAENAALVDDMNLLRNNNTALRSKIEAAENDDAHQKALAASALRVAEGWERKCGELRAKIEAMERQEPVGKFIRHPSNGLWEQDGYGDNPDARPLYALPGAQPKDEALWPTIANGMITPDGWKLVPIEPTPTMITAALESSHAINAHRAEYCYRAMLAAALEKSK